MVVMPTTRISQRTNLYVVPAVVVTTLAEQSVRHDTVHIELVENGVCVLMRRRTK